MNSIQLKNISKTYDASVKAVENINFKAEQGEFVVLVGPSGCGKSTILRIIAGLESITDGDLLFDDKKVNETHPKERNIGMVFQNYALYPHMSVKENLEFPLKIAKASKQDMETKVRTTSEIVGLQSYLDRKPKQLSGGQRQRVALGRALIRDPEIFLFDEPLSNLDAKLRVQMRLEILKIHRVSNAISIYVTHDQTEAMTMADKLVILDGGKVQQIGTPEDIYKDPLNLMVAEFIGSPGINKFEGRISKSDNKNFFLSNDNLIEVEISNQIYPNENVILTVRPEDIIFDESSNSEYEVLEIESLGHEKLIYLKSSPEIVVRVSNDHNYQIGDKHNIRLKGNYHLFDKSNGERID